MEHNQWDVVVIGAGPAGLSAALLLGRARRRTLVIDAGEPRNRFAEHMHGVLGNEGTSPQELREKGTRELAIYGIEVVPGNVERLDDVSDGVRVVLSGGEALGARAVIVATGIVDALPDVPGLAERWGASVLHCPYCHGWEVRDSKLGVLAKPNLGLHQAFLARQWSHDVTVFTAELGDVPPADQARLRSRGIKIIESPIVELTGPVGSLTTVHTADGSAVAIDAILTAGTPQPRDEFLVHLGLERGEVAGMSFVAVDATGKTSHDRIWAVGNIVNPMLTVPVSIGAGAMTGAAVNGALVVEDFDLAERGSSPAEFWETRYSGKSPVWSGQENIVLAEVVAELETGVATTVNGGLLTQRTALDLGCGEGGDALWLAQRGWITTGIDISKNAVARARQAAEAAGLTEEAARFIVADLSDFETGETFDLITANFLQSPVQLARADILRKATRLVAPGGHLLITAHATPPRAAGVHSGPGHYSTHVNFPSPSDDLAALELDPVEWTVILTELRPRTVTDPGREPFVTEDSVVLVQRR